MKATVAVPGGSLYVEVSGAGEPVLLLHAGITDRRVWEETMPALSEAGHQVIRYDSRGYGLSPQSDGPYSLVADAIAVLDAYQIGSAHLVGLSMGGATALDVAIAAPGRVRTLTLVAPGLSGFDWPTLPGYDERVALGEKGDAEGVALAIARLWVPMSFDGGADGDEVSQMVTDQAGMFMSDDPVVDEADARPGLGDIAVPTLVVLGDRDLDVITEIGTFVAERIPGASLITLPGADHALPRRVPTLLHPTLLTHLANSASPTRDE